MGLMAADLDIDTYSASGVSNRFSSRPAIHLMLSKEENEQRFALYQGSGGVASSLLSGTPSGANTHVSRAAPNKLAASVSEIRAAFGLTKKELATVCKVQSRKTLYNWINGETTPRKSAMSRIFDLLITARALTNSGISIDQEQLHRPVVDEQSVFDLLNKLEINKDLILFAGSRLNTFSPAKDELLDPFA